MKHLIFILSLLTFISCSVTNRLNKRIDKNQKASLIHSPFETAKGMVSELEMQKKFRSQYLKELHALLKSNKNDTIILTEKYNFICFGCPSDKVEIFTKNKLIIYKKRGDEFYYKRTIHQLTEKFQDATAFLYDDIFELKKELKNDTAWNHHPEKYGTDDCYDGDHTFYTIFYPNGKTESMYMRCWINKQFR